MVGWGSRLIEGYTVGFVLDTEERNQQLTAVAKTKLNTVTRSGPFEAKRVRICDLA